MRRWSDCPVCKAPAKSTLARQIAAAASAHGIATEVLALDDFYRGRGERAVLARTIHPLLATRGVPGTHDLALLDRTLRALGKASPRQPARIPRFDKGRDTRVPPSRWRRVSIAPRLILLEGWCVGVPAADRRETCATVERARTRTRMPTVAGAHASRPSSRGDYVQSSGAASMR